MSAEMQVDVEPVCSTPPGWAAETLTADGHVVAFWRADDGRMAFLWDGQPAGAPFDRVMENRDKTPAVFSSPDGAHVAYVGSRDGRLFVGRDDREDPPIDEQSRSVPPTFGGGGRHLAYGAKVGDGEYRLVVDGEPTGTMNLAPTAAVFSPEGERLAYQEMRGERRGDTEVRIVLDGVPGEWFKGTRNAPGAMQFSPDGRRFAYYEIDGDNHVRWVVDGVPQRYANEVPTLSVARLRGVGVLEPPLPASFSPDSQRFAYFADVVEKGVAIVENDVPGPLFKAVAHPVFSPDSRHLAYVAQTDGKKWTVVLDGVPGPEWDASGMGLPVFSADSQHVAVTVVREEGGFLRKRTVYTVAVDGRLFPEEQGDDAATLPEFSPDGSRVAWWLQREPETLLVVDGVVQQDSAVIGELEFDASGRIVYPGWVGTTQTIFVEGRPGPAADLVVMPSRTRDVYGHESFIKAPPMFRLSADGAHVAWAGQFGVMVRPVFDDEVGPEFDLFLECTFDGQGRAVWWFQRGDEVVKVTRTA